MGRAKARVLPEPVREPPIMSWPVREAGIVEDWMRVGVVMAMEEREEMSQGEIPMVVKVDFGSIVARIVEGREGMASFLGGDGFWGSFFLMREGGFVVDFEGTGVARISFSSSSSGLGYEVSSSESRLFLLGGSML